MREIGTQLFAWYLVVQLCGLVALPLTLRLFANLPDRGYAFAKSLGIFLVGLLFWLGYSYGLLRNEAGGAWLAVVLVAGVSLIVGSSLLRRRGSRADDSDVTSSDVASSATRGKIKWGYVLSVELLFLVAFLAWAVVRMYDPAVNHTEQPMDLMFMNGIWNSATYPPQDPWLAGYAISYYYFGYWLLTTLARLSGLTTAVAYNVGQACWYGLLLIGCYGVVTNLLAVRASESRVDAQDKSDDLVSDDSFKPTQRIPATAMLGGLIGSLAVGVVGNLQSIFEYLVATGRDISGLVTWFDVYNYAKDLCDQAAGIVTNCYTVGATENAYLDKVTNNWYIDFGWWWWRSSRVIEDLNLTDGHIEVIDEFPMFSYILGDNHPHVMAMPFVLLVIALAFNMLLHRPAARIGAGGIFSSLSNWTDIVPLKLLGVLILVAATGGLFFFNSWDFPPYWLLMMLTALTVLALQGSITLATGSDSADLGAAADLDDSASDADMAGDAAAQKGARATAGINMWAGALAFGGLIFLGMILLYIPYFLTAQSQAGGLVPNVFHPTKFRQFFLMFGLFMPSIVGLIWLAWRECRPSWLRLGGTVGLVLGLPSLFLLLCTMIGASVPTGERFLGVLVSPNWLFENGDAVMARRLDAPWTFLITGLLLAIVVALLWERWVQIQAGSLLPKRSLLFVLLLAAVGLLLTYAPEFVYLRDNFGTRMNTIFKFYYQAWLLFGLCSAYVIVVAFRGRSAGYSTVANLPVMGLALLSLLLMAGCMIFPIAGVYSKTNGFSADRAALTLDSTDHVTLYRPTERAAIDWIAENTGPKTIVLEGKGASYRAEYSMVSTMTGRPTLLGWDGHESQWRGQAYGDMSSGRLDVLNTVYRDGAPAQIADTLAEWGVEYVYVGPTERTQYEISPRREEVLARALDLAFESGDVQVYALR